jgi:NAD+ diphosphatase
MIHEIFPHHFNNRFVVTNSVDEDAVILHYHERSVLLKTNVEDPELPRKRDLKDIQEADLTFLFTFNDVPCFLLTKEPGELKSGLSYWELNFFRTVRKKEIAWVSIAGFHLFNWYTNNRFCGKCGAETHQKSDERALVCSKCASTVYPAIAPAIIVAIVCDDKILLARNTNFPGGWYSLIAGYVDIGETLEEALIREVKEEVGLDVWNIRYYKNQPWPLSGSMMIGFIAEADEQQPIMIDGKEIADAAWFKRGELPEHSLGLSIAGEMIGKFEKGEL